MARTQRSLGDYYFYHKEFEKCTKALFKATKINSYHANSWFVIGCSFMRLNRLDEAIPALSKCCQIDESNAEAWVNLAGCLQMKGEFDKAMAMLEQATKF